MKNFILSVILLIIGLTTNLLNAQGSWFSQTNPTTDSGESMQFVSATEGWINLTSNALLHTTNGGMNWQVVTPNATDVTAGIDAPGSRLSFVNATTGWVIKSLSSSENPQGAVLYKTTTSGDSWQRTVLSTTAGDAAIQVQFVDVNNGWLMIFNMNTGTPTFKKTTDGGANWTDTNGGGVFYYISPSVGYSFTAAPGELPSYTIYKTTDGGTNWMPQYTDTTPGGINDMRFTDANHGWAVGNNGKFFQTSDGGTNWTASIYNSNYNNSKVFFVNNSVGWIATKQSGMNPIILYTTNGGMSWTGQSLPFNYNVYSMSFWDANNGWAASDNGGLARYMYDPMNTYSNDTLGGPWFGSNSNPINPYNDNLNYIIFDGHGSIVGFNGFPAPASGNYNVNPDGTFYGNLILGTETTTFYGQLISQTKTINDVAPWGLNKIANPGALKDKISGTFTTQNCGTKNVVINIDNNGNIISATGLAAPVTGNVFTDQDVFLGHLKTGEPNGSGWNEFSISGYYSNDNLTGVVNLDNNSCGTTTANLFRTNALSVTENILKKSISIYPNPNNGKFNIDLKEVNSKIQLEIFNVWGQKIDKDFNLKHTTNEIDFSSIAKGIYLIKINDGENSYTEKMVIE